ncbi:unnamed protein product [Merluccius merluccius]
MESLLGADQTLPVDINGSCRLPESMDDGDCSPDSMTAPSFPDKMTPSKALTMKDYENQIAALKKENFNLKLRIYFMEERMQQKCDDSTEDVFRTNIELKVELESMKREMAEKQELLVSASKALESLASRDTGDSQRVREQARRDMEALQHALNKKIADLEQDLYVAKEEVEQMAAIAEQEKLRNIDMEKQLLEKVVHCDIAINRLQDEYGAQVQKLQAEKENLIQCLVHVYSRNNLSRAKVDGDSSRSKTPVRSSGCGSPDDEVVGLASESQPQGDTEVGQMKNRMRRCTLSGKLDEKENDLCSEKKNSLKRDKTIQGLSQVLKEKEKEISELCHEIDDRDEALAKARETAHKAQLQKYQGAEEHQSLLMEKQAELAQLQGEHHTKGLEAQKLQRSLARKEQELADMQQAKEQLEVELEDFQQQKKKGDKALNDLQNQLKKLNGEIRDRDSALEQQYQGLLDQTNRKLQAHEVTIQRLTSCLADKEQQLQEYMNMVRDFEQSRSPGGSDIMLSKLRERLKEKEKALEKALDEKFAAIEEKDNEIHELQLALREKERDLERLNNLLTHNNETINSFDSVIKEKDVELQHLANTLKNLQRAKQDMEDNLNRALREKDSIINQLQLSLQGKTKDMEEMAQAMLSQSQSQARDLAEQMGQRLKVTEAMLAEATKARENLVADNESAVEGLLATIGSKDQLLKESSEHYNRMLSEYTREIQELKRQLAETHQQLTAAEQHSSTATQDGYLETAELRVLLAEKDGLIKKLLERGQDREGFLAGPGPQEESEHVLRLRHTVQTLQGRLDEREAELSKMNSEDNVDNITVTRKITVILKKELAQKTEALNKALKRENELKISLAELQSTLAELEAHVKGHEANIESLTSTLETKDQIIGELHQRLGQHGDRQTGNGQDQASGTGTEVERSPSSLPQRERTIIGRDSQQKDLPSLSSLHDEHAALIRALKTEQQLFSSLIRTVKEQDSSQRLHALQLELAAVQLLRQQLEEGIKTNEGLRDELESELHRAQLREGNTLSFLGDQTSYLSICVGEGLEEGLSQLSPQELREKVADSRELCSRLESALQQMNASLAAQNPGGTVNVPGGSNLGLEQNTDRLQQRRWELNRLDTDTCEERTPSEASDALPGTHHQDYFIGHTTGEDIEGKSGCSEGSLTHGEITKCLSDCLAAAESAIASLAAHCTNTQSSSSETSTQTSPDLQHHLQRLQISLQELGKLEDHGQAEEAKKPSNRNGSAAFAGRESRPSSQELHRNIRLLYQAFCDHSQRISDLQGSLQEERRLREENETHRQDAKGQPGNIRAQVEGLQKALKDKKKMCKILEEKLASSSVPVVTAHNLPCVPAQKGKETYTKELSCSLARHEYSHSQCDNDLYIHILIPFLTQHLLPPAPPLEQDDKCVQVDLQDLGYETSGKSENDREESSSTELKVGVQPGDSACSLPSLLKEEKAEFSSAENLDSTSNSYPSSLALSSHKVSLKSLQAFEDYGVSEDPIELQAQVRELRLQLENQTRVAQQMQSLLGRNIFPSDLVSTPIDSSRDHQAWVGVVSRRSQERCYSGGELKERGEGESQRMRDKIGVLNKELERERSLNRNMSEQLQQVQHRSRSASPARLDSLVQSQARELSQLRQQIKESCGLGVSHRRQLGELSRAFQELLQASDVDLFRGDVLRGQLDKSLGILETLEERLDKGVCVLFWLSRELQEKNRQIQSLQSQLRVQSPGRPRVLASPSCSSSSSEVCPSYVVSGSGHSSPTAYSQHLAPHDLLAEHLQEIRALRQRLEESIQTNDRLREQLERRLAEVERDPAATNIFIQGSEEQGQLASEVRFLWEQNQTLKEQLSQGSRDKHKENDKLREALARRTAKLEQSRAEGEALRQERGRLQDRLELSAQEHAQLQDALHSSREELHRLQSDVNLQRQQLSDSQHLLQSLRVELKVCERIKTDAHSGTEASEGAQQRPSAGPLDLSELLSEIRHLRLQLERSIQTNTALRQRLEEQLLRGPSRPDTININYLLSTSGPVEAENSSQHLSSSRSHSSGSSGASEPPSRLVPGHRLWASRHGRHILGLIEDHDALRKQISEGRRLTRDMDAQLQEWGGADSRPVQSLSSSLSTMQRVLEEASRLLKLVWRVSLPTGGNTAGDNGSIQQDDLLRNEISRLKNRLSHQERLLSGAVKRLRTTNQLKEGMERVIIDQRRFLIPQ